MNRIFTLLLTVLIAQTGQSQGTSNIELIYNWTDASFPASNDFGNVYNEVWGFVQDEREYAVIGTTWGTHIFDVTDPSNIYMADSIAGAFQGGGVVHRDYHDYAGHLYMVCDEGTGQSTLQIADLSYLPDSVHVVYDKMEPLNKAHNIFILSLIHI